MLYATSCMQSTLFLYHHQCWWTIALCCAGRVPRLAVRPPVAGPVRAGPQELLHVPHGCDTKHLQTQAHARYPEPSLILNKLHYLLRIYSTRGSG